MNDQNLVRGLTMMAIALAFGLQSLMYPVGQFSRAGPGLFPLMVSGLLLLIGVITLVRSRLVARVRLEFQAKNIGIILGSLCGFVIVSKLLNMSVGIVFLVFFASMAATSYSVSRCIKVSLGLLAIAFAFQKLLGLNLPLY